MKKMSLRMKLFALITLAVAATLSIVSALVSSRSVEMSKQDAFRLADEMSAKYSYEIRAELQAARVTSESLMTVFQTLIERGEADRDTLNAVLQNSLRQKEYIISFCVAFEPNKLDGKDAEYAGQFPLYGESGRYAPYWSLQDGEIDVEPLSDFDDDVWYAGARDAGAEYITDPFFYEVQGTPVLMTSLVFPIIIDGEFIGIVSSDMALDSLQEMVSQVNTSGLGEFTEVYSNSGLIVAHPDDDFFNKSIYATSAYNMLNSQHDLLPQALKLAQAYAAETAGAADDAEAEAAAQDEAFVSSLEAYAENPGSQKLALVPLSDGMARALLQLDETRLQTADEATAAIAGGTTYTITEDGYYTVYTPIQFSEATNPWSVAVNVPMDNVLHTTNQIRNYVIMVSIVGIVLVALLLYFITRNLTKPILDLAEAAKQVGEGDFGAEIPPAKSSDEVGILATAFKKMVAQINELIGKLTRNSEELERKNKDLGELNTMLVEARDQAESSNQAKSVFLSNMSHEMRTPLNAIVGMTAIGKKAEEDERKDYAFRKIEEASAHLLSLVNDVLDMSKMEADKLELAYVEFNFGDMLQGALDLIKVQMQEKEQTLALEVDDSIPETLIGDDLRLSQVVINLLSNAVKFTGTQGEIGLKAFVKEVEGEVYTLQFEVADNGIGISEEQQAKLFRMFEQADNSTSRSFGGTGLGLALSKRIVAIMGGDIGVESVPGKGSVFCFTVKIQRGLGMAEGAAGEAGQPPCDFCGKRLLLAEDIEINREIVLAMLEDTGLEIDCAANGKEACEMFAARPGQYNLILMDIQMPVMDGLEATRQIRAQDADIPIIAMTANVFKEDVDKYMDSGMNTHIGKPLDYDLTMEILGKYLS